jgi:uncharacterized membrane protein
MTGLHFPLLLVAAFLPYATTVMGHYPGNPLAALLLGLVVGALLAVRSALQSRAARDGVLQPEVDLRRYQAEAVVSWIVTGYWAVTLLLVWWTPWVEIPWFLTPAIGTVARFASRRTRKTIRARSRVTRKQTVEPGRTRHRTLLAERRHHGPSGKIKVSSP